MKPKNKICIPENKTIDAINVGYPIGIFGLFNFSNIIKIKAIRLIIEITKPKIKKILRGKTEKFKSKFP